MGEARSEAGLLVNFGGAENGELLFGARHGYGSVEDGTFGHGDGLGGQATTNFASRLEFDSLLGGDFAVDLAGDLDLRCGNFATDPTAFTDLKGPFRASRAVELTPDFDRCRTGDLALDVDALADDRFRVAHRFPFLVLTFLVWV